MKYIITPFSQTFLLILFATAQNVGLEISNPLAKLDVNGDMILMGASLSLVNGNIIDKNITTDYVNYPIKINNLQSFFFECHFLNLKKKQ